MHEVARMSARLPVLNISQQFKCLFEVRQVVEGQGIQASQVFKELGSFEARLAAFLILKDKAHCMQEVAHDCMLACMAATGKEWPSPWLASASHFCAPAAPSDGCVVQDDLRWAATLRVTKPEACPNTHQAAADEDLLLGWCGFAHHSTLQADHH